MDSEFVKLSQSASSDIIEIVNFVKFGELILCNQDNCVGWFLDYLIQQLKVDKIEPHRLPHKDTMKQFYTTDEVVILCRKNNLLYLINMCIKVLFDYVIMELKENQLPNFEFLKAIMSTSTVCIQSFRTEKNLLGDNFCMNLIFDTVDCLFELLEQNYSQGFTRDTAKTITFTRNVILTLKDYDEVRRHIIRHFIKKLPYFASCIQVQVEHEETFSTFEYLLSYLILVKEIVEYTMMSKSLDNKEVDYRLCNKDELKYVLECLRQMANCTNIFLRTQIIFCLECFRRYEYEIQMNQ